MGSATVRQCVDGVQYAFTGAVSLHPDGIYGNQAGQATATAAAGNQYVTSTFLSTIVLGSTTLTSASGSDIFVARRSASTWLWAVRVVALAGATAVLHVYPNPAAGAATLVGAETGASVQLLDALGRVVATPRVDAAGQAWLPSGLPAGVCIVRSDGHTVRWNVR